MSVLKSKSNRIILPAFALCLFILTIIWVSYFRQRSFDRKDSIRFAVNRNSNLAVALEQYAIRTLHNADAVLQVVKMEYADQGESLDLKKLLNRISISQDIDDCVSIVGADGRLKKTNITVGKAGPDFSATPNFIFHSQNDIDTLLIGKPTTSGTIGHPVIVVSRRLFDDKGGFAGMVTLQIAPTVFTSLYAQAHLLSNDIVSFISLDGITYARRTGTVESSGESISKSPLFKHIENHTDSFYFAPDAIKSIPTWFSYRKLNHFPIIATVGSSEADILDDFTKRQSGFIIPRVIISILVMLFSFFITQFLLHRRRVSERMAAEEKKYQRLLTEQMIAVQEREREWIGRELHDNVNQVLTSVKLYLETVHKEARHILIPRSIQLINNSISDIRDLSRQLSAPTLGTGSLIDSINALIETMADSSSLEFEFDYNGYAPVTMSQKLAIYRILQEQLNNIVKHARATRVFISLSESNGTITLTIRDNGVGFDRTQITKGMGINNIISRAKVFEGKVQVESAPRKGCSLTVTMPAVAVVEEKCLN